MTIGIPPYFYICLTYMSLPVILQQQQRYRCTTRITSALLAHALIVSGKEYCNGSLLLFLFLFYHKEIREAVSSLYAYISTLGIFKAVVPVTKFSVQTPHCPDFS